MSHYNLLVTKTNTVSVEQQLRPFEEQKWDWYAIGRRWRGYFTLKPGTTGALGERGAFGNERRHDADVALAKDIDWEAMREARREQAGACWEEFQAAESEGERLVLSLQYGVEQGDAREDFIKRLGSVATFAVLHEGVWHERGEIGWWGVVHNPQPPEVWQTQFSEIVQQLQPEDEMTVVDCHV